MPKKRSRKTKVEEKGQSNEIVGVLLITIGLLTLYGIASGFIPKLSAGSFGMGVRKGLLSIFGLGAYVFPFFIMVIGIYYIRKNGRLSFNKRFYGIILFLVNTLLSLQMINYSKYNVSGDILIDLSNLCESKSIMHGGIFAYLIDIPIKKLFGYGGSGIIFTALYLISIMIVFGISLNDIIDSFKEKVNKASLNRTTRIDDESLIIENIPGQEVRDQDTVEKDGVIKRINNKIKIIDFMKSSNSEDEAAVENIRNDERKNTSVVKESPHISSNNKEVNNNKREIEKTAEEIKITTMNAAEQYEYIFPKTDLLNENKNLKAAKSDKRELLDDANKLQETLKSFGVNAKVIQVTKGPSVTRFEIQPEIGVKVSKIINLSDDIALNLASSGIRIEAPIPGKAAVGIEVPNKTLTPVYIRELLESKEFKECGGKLTIGLGKDLTGKCVTTDLSKMPHVLIAGATGSGKSVCINTLVTSLLYKYSPNDVKLLMVDPKVVELNVYNGIPHLLIPVVTDSRKAAGALNWAVNEMERRYKGFAESGVKNIEGFNELFEKGIVEEKMPYVVIIIDELADLMMVAPKDVEGYIARLAQMARAAGMHLVIATQRPSVDVITGMIKANIPSRISFAVSSQIDSRTILDSSGAEKLLGKGDMLFYPVGTAKPVRIQGGFISESEVERIVDFIKRETESVEYKEEIMEEIQNSTGAKGNKEDGIDRLLSEAINFVVESERASTSMLQRRFKIGYNRAARLIDDMEERGIISGRNGSKPRQVLLSKQALQNMENIN